MNDVMADWGFNVKDLAGHLKCNTEHTPICKGEAVVY